MSRCRLDPECPLVRETLLAGHKLAPTDLCLGCDIAVSLHETLQEKLTKLRNDGAATGTPPALTPIDAESIEKARGCTVSYDDVFGMHELENKLERAHWLTVPCRWCGGAPFLHETMEVWWARYLRNAGTWVPRGERRAQMEAEFQRSSRYARWCTEQDRLGLNRKGYAEWCIDEHNRVNPECRVEPTTPPGASAGTSIAYRISDESTAVAEVVESAFRPSPTLAGLRRRRVGGERR